MATSSYHLCFPFLFRFTLNWGSASGKCFLPCLIHFLAFRIMKIINGAFQLLHLVEMEAAARNQINSIIEAENRGGLFFALTSVSCKFNSVFSVLRRLGKERKEETTKAIGRDQFCTCTFIWWICLIGCVNFMTGNPISM